MRNRVGDLKGEWMIKRIMNFDKKDWKHVSWLFRNMIKDFWLCNFEDSHESWLFLKLHLTHDHTRLKRRRL